MKCFRYAFEGYQDNFQRLGYYLGTKIFVPVPYNFCVFILNDEIKYIKRQLKIDDFKNNYYTLNPKIIEIDMEEDLIKELFNNLEKEEKVMEERKILKSKILNKDNLYKIYDEYEDECVIS